MNRVATEQGASSSRWATVRHELLLASEIAALCGFAVVQPVLAPFGESPQSFMAASATPREVLDFALIVTFVPILALAALAAATRVFGRQVREAVQLGLVAVLVTFAATYVIRDVAASGWFDLGTVAGALLAVAAGGLAVLAYRRWAWVGTYLRFASLAPLLLLATFVWASPTSPWIRPAVDGLWPGAADPAPVAPPVEEEQPAGPGEPVTGDAPSVVMVVLDELPTLSLVADGAIDADLFPNLAAFADTSTWYRNHTTVAQQTEVAVPAILTGQLPSPDGAGIASYLDHPDNLLTLLAPTHRVHTVEWATDMCPPDTCTDDAPVLDPVATELAPRLLAPPPPAMETLLDSARSLWWGQVWPLHDDPVVDLVEPGAGSAPTIVRPGLDFLSGLDDRAQGPTVEYLHVALPHVPWLMLPTGEAYNGASVVRGLEVLHWGEADPGPDMAAAGRTRHILQLQWVDRLLGAVFDRLQELDRWDDSVVVVTADHGVSFVPGTFAREMTPDSEASIAWTPLLVKAPGQTVGVVDDSNVLTVDILPTVAELVGVAVPWDVDGRSAVGGPPRADGGKPILPWQSTAALESQGASDVDDDGYVHLAAGGLDEITGADGLGDPGDPLRTWRAGRHGDLLGQEVDALGVCEGEGSSVEWTRPAGWRAFSRNPASRPRSLPLWHSGRLGDEGARALAMAVNGRIAGWSATRNTEWGLLLAEPLMTERVRDVEFFEVLDDRGAGGCSLRSLPIED